MNDRDPFRDARRDPRSQQHAPKRKRYEQLFFYPVSFDLAGPGTTDTETIQFQDKSDFRWMKTAYYATLNGAAAPFTDDMIAEVTLNMQLTSGEYLTNGPVPISSMAGTGRLPFILPQYRLFLRQSTLKLVAQNISAAATYDNVTLVLIGTQVYDFAPRDED